MTTEPTSKGQNNYGKIGDVHLSQVPELSECNPGLEPTEYNVVIAPAVMPDKIGLILLADDTKETRGLAMQVGRIVSASPIAFNYERWPEGSTPPKAGDIVWFARYAGGMFTGMDEREYRIVKDKDIGAIITAKVGKAIQAVKAA